MSPADMQIRRVRLLGERLTLRTDLSQEELDSIAAFANEKLSRFVQSNATDPKKQILLGVLHLAGELLESRGKLRDLTEEQLGNEHLTKQMLEKLEEI